MAKNRCIKKSLNLILILNKLNIIDSLLLRRKLLRDYKLNDYNLYKWIIVNDPSGRMDKHTIRQHSGVK